MKMKNTKINSRQSVLFSKKAKRLKVLNQTQQKELNSTDTALHTILKKPEHKSLQSLKHNVLLLKDQVDRLSFMIAEIHSVLSLR